MILVLFSTTKVISDTTDTCILSSHVEGDFLHIEDVTIADLVDLWPVLSFSSVRIILNEHHILSLLSGFATGIRRVMVYGA